MNHLRQIVQDQLDDYVRRLGLASLTLANEDGLLIATCGHTKEAEMLAAISPLLHYREESSLQILREQLRKKGLNISVLDIQMEGQSLFLCVTGADQQINHPDLRLLLDELAKQLVLAQSGDC